MQNFSSQELSLSDISVGESVGLGSIIDTHVHSRWNEYAKVGITPDLTVDEAKRGGIGTLCMMPNTKPALIDLATCEEYLGGFSQEKNKEIEKYCYFGLCDDSIEEAKRALEYRKILGVKVYPVSGSGKSVTTSFSGKIAGVQDLSLEPGSPLCLISEILVEKGKTLTIHCETPGMGTEKEAEEHFIETTLLPLAKKFPLLKLIVPHVTLASTAKKILQWNEEYGTKIHMELTAHHLFFAQEVDYGMSNSGFLKVFPHIRTTEDREYLCSLLPQIGNNPYLFLMFGSDHAPHPLVSKSKEFAIAPAGISSLADAVGIILTIAEKRGCSVEQMRRFFSGTARELFSLSGGRESVFKKIYDGGQGDFSKKFFGEGEGNCVGEKENMQKNLSGEISEEYYGGAVHNPFKGFVSRYCFEGFDAEN